MIKYYIGCDPGISGGIVVAKEDNGVFTLVDAFKVPTIKVTVGKKKKSFVDSYEIFRRLKVNLLDDKPKHVGVVIERVHAMPNQGVSSIFTFGYTTGNLTATLELALRDYVEGSPLGTTSSMDVVTPSVWKKYFGITKNTLTKIEKKDIAISKATELAGNNNYWKRKSDDGVAEAYLLTRYIFEKNKAKTQ